LGRHGAPRDEPPAAPVSGAGDFRDPPDGVSSTFAIMADLLGQTAEPWRAKAGCASPDVDRRWFYPARGDMVAVAAAKAVCWACPVTAECLDYALSRPEIHGIWGGLGARERRGLRAVSEEP